MERRQYRHVALGVAALATGLAVSSHAIAEPATIGAVIQRNYKGAIAEHREIARHAIYFANDVHAEEKISTGYNGATRLRLLDDSQVAVGANAEIVLDEFVYDPGTLTSSGLLEFSSGAFRYVGGEAKHKEGLKLVTPTATLAIRGTELVIFVAPSGRTEVNVIEGAITVTACGGGGSQDLGAGEQATIDPNCGLSVDKARKLAPHFIPRMPRGFGAEDGVKGASSDPSDSGSMDRAKERVDNPGRTRDVGQNDDHTPKDTGSGSQGGGSSGGGSTGGGSGGKPKGGGSTSGGSSGGSTGGGTGSSGGSSGSGTGGSGSTGGGTVGSDTGGGIVG